MVIWIGWIIIQRCFRFLCGVASLQRIRWWKTPERGDTVWKFSNFPATLILCNINFGRLKVKACHLNHFEDFDVLEFMNWECSKFPKIQTSKLLNSQNLISAKINFTWNQSGRKLWVISLNLIYFDIIVFLLQTTSFYVQIYLGL